MGKTGKMEQIVKSSDIVGVWEAKNKTKIEVFKAGIEYQSRLLYAANAVERDGVTFKKDVRNPDPVLRTRSLQNAVDITGMVWDEEKWTGGHLYYRPSGGSYKCYCKIKDGKLLVRDYILSPLFGTTLVFTRVN